MSVTFLLCADFEATCFPQGEQNWFAEIIEFAVVLLHLDSGRIIEEFHQFVKPTHFPYLSRGCLDKLNISQATINNSQTLNYVLQDFQNWINCICRQYNVVMPQSGSVYNGDNMLMCTWSHADLNTFLRNECLKKNIYVPNELKYYVDAQKVAQNTFHVRGKLEEAMADLRVRQEGRSHSGLNDARNLARLVVEMYRLGGRFNMLRAVRP